MLEKVVKNNYGFYELRDRTTIETSARKFKDEYFQNSTGQYESKYAIEEIEFFMNKVEQKEIAIRRVLQNGKKKIKILDIGCGEGFLLKYFWKKGNDVVGIDFSRHAMENNNPEVLPYLRQGDCYEIVEELVANQEKYDVINMDAVLDMVQEPARLLEIIKPLLNKKGLVVCKVGNQYSHFQLELLEKGILSREYWLDEKGHPSYFSKDGFINFFEACGYQNEDIYAEGLIEFNLLNKLTNYYENPQTGKACYRAKIDAENMLHTISPEKTNEIMQIFGQMGLGREIVGIFSLKR